MKTIVLLLSLLSPVIAHAQVIDPGNRTTISIGGLIGLTAGKSPAQVKAVLGDPIGGGDTVWAYVALGAVAERTGQSVTDFARRCVQRMCEWILYDERTGRIYQDVTVTFEDSRVAVVKVESQTVYESPEWRKKYIHR